MKKNILCALACCGSLVVANNSTLTQAAAGEYRSGTLEQLSNLRNGGLDSVNLSGFFDGSTRREASVTTIPVLVPVLVPPITGSSDMLGSASNNPSLKAAAPAIDSVLQILNEHSPTGTAICAGILPAGQSCSIANLNAAHVTIEFGKVSQDALAQTHFDSQTGAVTITISEAYKGSNPALTAVVLSHELAHAEIDIKYPSHQAWSTNLITAESNSFIQEAFVAHELDAAQMLPSEASLSAPIELLESVKRNTMDYTVWRANIYSPFADPSAYPSQYPDIATFNLSCSNVPGEVDPDCINHLEKWNKDLSSHYSNLQKLTGNSQSIAILERIGFLNFVELNYGHINFDTVIGNLRAQPEYQDLFKRLLNTSFPADLLCGTAGKPLCANASIESQVFTIQLALERACMSRPGDVSDTTTSLIRATNDGLSMATLKTRLPANSCMTKLLDEIAASKLGFGAITSKWINYVFAYNFPTPAPTDPSPNLPPVDPCKPGDASPDSGTNASSDMSPAQGGTPWVSSEQLRSIK